MEPPKTGAADAALIRFLEDRGYEVNLRHSTWWECLLERGEERWLGSGASEASALEDALRHALPSDLGRSLLARARSGWPQAVESEFEPEFEPESDGSSEADGSAPQGVPQPLAPELLEPTTEGVTTLIPRAPATLRTPRRVGRRLPQMGVDEALESLANCLDGIRAASVEVAGWVPQWQRLQILAWIAGARSFQDSVADSRVTAAVAQVASELGHLSAIWWPGNVPALQVNTYAAECSAALELDSKDETPRSWLEVAELSERTLKRSMQRADDAGSDERGWMDAHACHPPPPDPPGALAEIMKALEERTGPLLERPGAIRPSRSDGPSPVDLARRLRWLRLVTLEPSSWGAAAGRLRWLSTRLDRRERESLSAELDPSFAPRGGWARLLGHDPERRQRALRRRDLLKRSPREGDGRSAEETAAWLREALDCDDLAVDRLADLVQPVRTTILEFDSDSLADGRRGRRRVRKLLDCLNDPGQDREASDRVLAAEIEAAQAESQAAGCPAGQETVPDAQEAMLEVVLPHTRGKTALIVGNRLDPELDEMLRGTFEFSDLDHKLAGPRRIGALAERIRSGRYDIVLSITGFQYHSTDQALASAASAGGVAYVRTNRGRKLACIQALYRDLGLATSRP